MPMVPAAALGGDVMVHWALYTATAEWTTDWISVRALQRTAALISIA